MYPFDMDEETMAISAMNSAEKEKARRRDVLYGFEFYYTTVHRSKLALYVLMVHQSTRHDRRDDDVSDE